jgi:hypothetical protein
VKQTIGRTFDWFLVAVFTPAMTALAAWTLDGQPIEEFLGSNFLMCLVLPITMMSGMELISTGHRSAVLVRRFLWFYVPCSLVFAILTSRKVGLFPDIAYGVCLGLSAAGLLLAVALVSLTPPRSPK